MGAIILNAKKLELDVMPYVKSAHAKLNNICPLSQELNNIQISFNNKYLITNIVNELSTIKKETIDFENKLADQLSKINVAERKYSESAQNIYARANKTSALKDNSKLFYTYEEKKTTKLTNSNSQSTKKIVSILKNSKAVQKFKEIGAKIASDVSSLTQKIKNVSFSAKDWIKKFFNDTDLLKNVRAATGASYSSGNSPKTIWDTVTSGFNTAGAEIRSGVHTAGVWISDKATSGAHWVKGKANSIWNGVKNWWNRTRNSAKEQLKKVGASIANAVISFSKGVVSLLESLVDGVILLETAARTVITGTVDIVRGVSTGNWDWKATKGIWKETKAIVGYSITDTVYDSFYNTKVGKWLDDNAYAPFKSDGIACKIIEGTGYVTGVVALSVVTGGVYGLSQAAAIGFTSGVSGFGKYTQEEWNKNNITLNYGLNELNIAIDYKKYSEIKNLRQGQSTTLTQQIADTDGSIKDLIITITAKGNGEYDIVDSEGNTPALTSLKESSTLKGLGVGAIKGAWEGFSYYTGAKINGLFKSANALITNKFAGAGIRVALDTLTGAFEVPFQSLISMFSDNLSWKEAWDANGGWSAVGSQAVLGAIMSSAGELGDMRKAFKASKNIKEALVNNADDVIQKELKNMSDLDIKKMLDELDSVDKLKVIQNFDSKQLDTYLKYYLDNNEFDANIGKFNINEFNDKYPDSLVEGARKLQNNKQVAEYFSDPKGYLATFVDANQLKNISDTDLFDLARKNLNEDEFKIFENLFNNRRLFTEEEEDLLYTFAALGGPAIDAYLRGVDVPFRGHIFKGGNYKEMNDYFHRSLSIVGATPSLQELDIDDAIKMLDNIVENSAPLKEPLIVTRNIDDIFNNGNKILSPKVGMLFDDKAFLSTSAAGQVFGERKIRLEIEIPAGTKAAYIEPGAMRFTGYKQQEVLLGRNNVYKISDVNYNDKSAQYVIKAKLVSVQSGVQAALDATLDNGLLNSKKYFNNYAQASVPQRELNDVISDMKNRGLMAQYEAEVRDMKNSYIYKSAIAGHGEDHIEDVLFNAMYISEKENFDSIEKKLLIEAAKLHDAGKSIEGIAHGIQGAEAAKNYFKDFSDDDIAIIQAAIEYHSIPDNLASLNAIFDKYNVASSDRRMAERIANALKDADALDRSRYPGNLKEEFLRTDSAKSLVMASHQLQEIKGKQFLDELLSGNIQDSDKILINNLRQIGLSDYEIAFWIKFQPSQVGGTIGIWKKINDKINLLVTGGG